MSLKIARKEGRFTIEAKGSDDVITTPDLLDIAPVIAHYFGIKEAHDIYKKHGVCLLCDAEEAALLAEPLTQELIKRAMEIELCVNCVDSNTDHDTGNCLDCYDKEAKVKRNFQRADKDA